MACPQISIPGVDGALYARLVQQALSGGATFDGDRWLIHGCEFSVIHDLQSGTLHITPMKKPFLVPCSFIESNIEELIANAKEAT